MIPKTPVIEGSEADETMLGENQPEFQTLPTIYFEDHEGKKALSRWELEEDEREEFLRSGSIFVSQITGGAAPNPILPSIFPPVIPDQTQFEVTGEPRPGLLAPASLIFEFRLVPLDRVTGNPLGTFERSARLFADLASFSAVFNEATTDPSADAPEESIDLHGETLARILATQYGADVYFRALGAEGFRVVEGKLDNGAHANRLIRAGNSGLPDVDVAILDVTGSASVAEAVAMMKAVRDTFAPPFRLLGMSHTNAPDVVQAFGQVITVGRFDSIPGVVAHFRTMLRPKGDYLLLIEAGAMKAEASLQKSPANFLLDMRLYDKARSN